MALDELPTTLGGAAREFSRHASPRILAGLVAGSFALRLVLSDWSGWDALVVLALVVVWPLQEWLIHVVILHFRPLAIGSRTLDFAVPRMHREHHRDPWRLDRVFIPLHVYLYAALAVLGAAWTLESARPLVFSFFSAYFALALHYEWAHFLVHTRYRPTTPAYARMWQNHRLHHFKNEHYWYGVTRLGGDRLLHTAPHRDAVPTSPTARSLHPPAG